MHKYLRAVGFSDRMNAMDRLNLIDDIKTKSSYKKQAPGYENDGEILTEYRLPNLNSSVNGTFTLRPSDIL